MKKTTISIKNELDSDDELPDTYKDALILPAYQDDSRFDEIKFPWLNTINLNRGDPTVSEVQHDVFLRRRGVLKGQDLYCLKSVETCSSSTTFAWFINFLLYKDLLSHYNYRGCLVNDIISKPLTDNSCSESEDNVSKERYEIVIKV